MSSLNLDSHAKDKLLRLVQNRYNSETDVLTLNADRCPMKHQNKDYAMYLLHVLVSESKVKFVCLDSFILHLTIEFVEN